MKKILVSMLAVAAMVACSNEHTLVEAPKSDAIGFDTFVDNATRANDVTSTTIEDFGFGVYASVTNGAGQSGLILTNEKVTFDGNAWGYKNTQYWVAGNDYNFAAIAPYTDAKWTYTPANGTAQNGEIYFDNAAAAANQDLVFATAARKVTVAPTSKPDAVAFTFNHMLSRVRFSFANGFQSAGNIELAVSNVHITDAYANGTIEVEDHKVAEAWTPADKNLDVNFGVVAYDNSAVEFNATAAARIAESTKLSSEYFYLIPNSESATYTVTFDVTLYQAGVKIDTYSHTVALTCAMNRGCSYDIKTTLTPENTSDDDSTIYPIEFTVTEVEDWANYSEVATKELTKVATAQELADAIAAGESVKLTADINLDSIATTRAAYDSYGLAIEKDCVIDGNGHKITTSVKRAIAVCEPVNVTLKNFILNAGGERGIQVEAAANVLVEDVVATAKNYALNNTSTGANANIAIKNCDFSGLNVINVWGENAVVNINDTTLRCKDDAAAEGYSVVSNNGKNAVVNVNGGEVVITGSNSEDTIAGVVNEEGAQVNFVGTAGNPVVVTAYFAINYADNTRYTFTTFEEALETAVAGETIVMINDLTTDKTLKVTKKVTLDLNGKSLNVTNPGVAYTDAIKATTGAELTITGNGTVSADWGAIVAMKDAKVVVVNGTFYGNESEVVFVQNTASVEILGGSYKQNQDPSITLNKLDQHRDTTSIVVKGGKYFNFNPADNAAEGANTNFVATGYTVEQEGDWYVVK